MTTLNRQAGANSVPEHRPRGKMNNAFDPNASQDLAPATAELVRRRERLLGPAYRLFYQEPVHVVRGEGSRVWDADGVEYLDAYNNVVSVGHANARVVEAVHEQMRTLCTHTRYLHEGILKYAEDLLATFSGPVRDGYAMFTCTGSEANDLALRMAKHYTGHNGIIVTSEAYHGNSTQTAAISPSLGENCPLDPWVRRVPAPDSYRIDPASLPTWFADQVRLEIEDLERHGAGLAAFIVDSLFTSDGIYSDPITLLAQASDVVHQAGGVLIADEVQCGFARTGEQMWGYQRHDVRPDIVTLGKPMGNGYPVAGLAATEGVLAAFGHDVRYFNTFGGNTVAIAAAQATLDVIQDDGLLDNAARVGTVLRDGFARLSARYDQLGDVRGSGLYWGLEIIADGGGKVPDGATAAALVNALRRRRVLVSATGASGNVLKIRPPLVFTAEDADRLLTELEAALAETQAPTR